MIVCKNDFEKSLFSEPGLEPDLTEFRDPSNTELGYMMIPTGCENGFESMHLSEPDIKLNLILSTNFPKTELKPVKILKFKNKYTDFSEPKPKLKNLFKSFFQ